jgi:general secretion pathway protein K
MRYMSREKTMNITSLKNLHSQRGIALLLVLWILTILMVIVMSFSFMTRTETLTTSSFKGNIEKKFIAEGGIERAIMEIFYRNLYKNQTVELEGREVWKIDGTPYSGEAGNGSYTVNITDESGKVDINKASDVVLRNFFINYGLQEEDADTIADSILDWRDPDDLHRLHGAESDYYMSLPNPYKAKDARFDTLEEILLVKGVTPELTYGSGDKKGIMEFLTVNAKDRRINVNAAPKEVLTAVPGMTPELADALIERRQIKEITVQDLAEILGATYNVMMPFVSTTGGNVFTIDSAGQTASKTGVYGIRATVTITDQENYKILYYKSPVSLRQ